MQKIVVDTNVLVSALIQRGYPYHIMSEVFSNQDIELCISDTLFEEYLEVLNRKKFNKYIDFKANSQAFLVDIEKRANKYYPVVIHEIITDRNDNKLLELAETCKADFLITGNHNDFTMKEFKGTKIVNPKEYWTKYIR